MIKEIKQHKTFQAFLRFVNYYLSVRALSVITEGLFIWKDNLFVELYKNIHPIIFPRDFSTILLITITIVSMFILDFKRNKLISISFAFNVIIVAIAGIVGYAFYTNS